MTSKKRTVLLTSLALFAATLPLAAHPQDSVTGDWHARFESESGKTATFYLEMRTSDWKHNHTWGDTHKPTEFASLDPKLAATGGPAHFELRREAGTLSFEGNFHSGTGSGSFRFSASPDFVQSMKALGYSGLSIDQLLACATQDVTTQFVKELNNLGYHTVPADQ